MIYIGIDPGGQGGIAAVWATGSCASTHKMPETERDLLDILRSIQATSRCHAILERVRSSPQMGVSSAFTFGCGYGRLRMALTAADIPFDEVVAVKWQGVMGVRQKTGARPLGGPNKKDKNINKQKAQDLFPSVKVTHAIADALLLAEYGRRLEVRP